DWSSDVCSSDLEPFRLDALGRGESEGVHDAVDRGGEDVQERDLVGGCLAGIVPEMYRGAAHGGHSLLNGFVDVAGAAEEDGGGWSAYRRGRGQDGAVEVVDPA